MMTLARTYRLWDIKQTAMGSVARLARSRRDAKRDRVLDRGFHLFWKHCRFVPPHPVIRLAVPLLCWDNTPDGDRAVIRTAPLT